MYTCLYNMLIFHIMKTSTSSVTQICRVKILISIQICKITVFSELTR